MPNTGRPQFLRAIRGSIAGAVALLTFDADFDGSFLMSVLVCPVWFFISFVKNAVVRRDWGVALMRVAMPVLAFGLVKLNSDYQLGIAETNARRVIAACDAYHAANGQFPKNLKELVPEYLDSLPPAKHCLGPSSMFHYFNSGAPTLYWVIAGFYRKFYNFSTRSWSYLD